MMETKLDRIASVAKTKPEECFTSLYHLMNEEMLTACHRRTEKGKSPGIDGETKDSYERNLKENVSELVGRLHRFSYRPSPVLRAHIAKDDGSNRQLGIQAYEDKLVQLGLTRILNSIYEQDFLDCSYGFRPGRNCHDALKALALTVEQEKVSYIVDADIKGFFDNVDHTWLIRFLEHRIADPRVIRLIKRMLRAGVMNDGVFEESDTGTPQGSPISPLLANLYLHYVLDIWFEKRVKKGIQGYGEIIRYADDFVCCFQYRKDAEAFLKALRARLAKFGLSLAEDKTKIMEFGRFAETNARENGKTPDTFDFLGFTHFCGKSRTGMFRVKRKTSKKKQRKNISNFKTWIKSTRNTMKLNDIMELVRLKLLGHYRYYGITDNSRSISNFYDHAVELLYKWLNRRSQKKSFDWPRYKLYLDRYPLPRPRIYVSIYS